MDHPSVNDLAMDPELDAGISGKLAGGGHILKARIYFADTDFTGVVYHARYLEFLERGRSDFLRLVGIHHTELAEGLGGDKPGEVLSWVVRRMQIEFRQPARIDDIVTVLTRVEEISGARIRMKQELLRGSDLLIDAVVEAAIVGAGGKPRRFPKAWLPAFMPPAE